MYRHIQELQKRVAVIEQELRLEALSNENTRIKRQLSELEGQEKIVFLETLRQSREISELENVSEVYGRLRISNRKLFDVVKEHGLFGGEPKAREPLQDLQKGIKDIEKELRASYDAQDSCIGFAHEADRCNKKSVLFRKPASNAGNSVTEHPSTARVYSSKRPESS
ncbi:unnamed protein product [Bursaphelenchus xylophilus]|uniref:(pine wood nematode) hypothetical protein n=1 Tax=Bursaphelenchus xylophilus TaxID=6326 RepID=A0A1I7SRP9_BURXY|nr:unnamed protein product [Bursaphelenchus xylophilus]CAG9102016.1 unnamed protein product [Bursaphelenchus xylophilus]